MRTFILAALALAVPATASAAPICQRLQAETVFHCTIDGSSRTLSVCDLPDGGFLYSYGRPGAAELTMRREKSELAYRPWNGVGFSIWASLTFHNEGYRYEVWFDALKDESRPVNGGVHIYAPGEDPAAGRPTASRECRPGTVETRLDEIESRFR